MSQEIDIICDANGELSFHVIRKGQPGIKYCTAGTQHGPGQTLTLILDKGEIKNVQ